MPMEQAPSGRWQPRNPSDRFIPCSQDARRREGVRRETVALCHLYSGKQRSMCWSLPFSSLSLLLCRRHEGRIFENRNEGTMMTHSKAGSGKW